MVRLNPSRDIKLSGPNGDRENIIFSIQLTTTRMGPHARLIQTMLLVLIIHIHTYGHGTHRDSTSIAIVLPPAHIRWWLCTHIGNVHPRLPHFSYKESSSVKRNSDERPPRGCAMRANSPYMYSRPVQRLRGGRGCNIFVPVWGRDGSKIAPTRDMFDQPPGQMRSIRGKLAHHVGDHVVSSPEGAVLVTSSGTKSSYPRPPQSLNPSAQLTYICSKTCRWRDVDFVYRNAVYQLSEPFLVQPSPFVRY